MAPGGSEVISSEPGAARSSGSESESAFPPGRVTLAGAGSDGLARPLTYSWAQLSGDPVTLEDEDTATAHYFGLAQGPRTFELTVTASGTASSDPNADPLTFAWTLEAGAAAGTLAAADGQVARLTPAADGRYGVVLVVNDGTLSSAPSWCEVLAIDPANTDHVPVANAGPDGVGEIGKALQLDGSASYDVDGDLLAYTWRKVSGPAGVLSSSSVAGPTFRPGAAGTLVLELVVSDGTNLSPPDPVSFEVLDPAVNHRPVARVNADFATTVGSLATLDGTKSNDPDGEPLTFTWTQLEGPAVSHDDPASAKPSFIALRPGHLRFALTVSDGKAVSAEAVVSVLVTSGANRPPVANAGPDARVLLGSPVQLDGSGSSDPDADPLRYVWEQVLGPPVVLGGEAAKPTFQPPNRGVFRFRLVVRDAEAPSFPDEVEVVASTHGVPGARAGRPDRGAGAHRSDRAERRATGGHEQRAGGDEPAGGDLGHLAPDQAVAGRS
ncbi:MAG: PKD domain-containing protein [Myxococcaceae bacterium]